MFPLYRASTILISSAIITISIVTTSIMGSNVTSTKTSTILTMQNGANSANNTVATSLFAATPSWVQDYTVQPNGPVNTSVWHLEQGNNDGWGNNEVENYTSSSDNARIENGNLIIEARKQGSVYTSARLTTEGSLDFTYGKLDIVAKLPTGKGIWPALWLWPSDDVYSSQPLAANQQDVSWLANGEIDMFEGSAQGDNDFSGSAHAINHYPGHSERTGVVSVNNPSTSYHTYSLEWAPQSLIYMLDGKPFKTVQNSGAGFMDWPYNQRYHLIMNIAMGGTMSQNLISSILPHGIDESSSPWQLQVQSIRYYPLAN